MRVIHTIILATTLTKNYDGCSLYFYKVFWSTKNLLSGSVTNDACQSQSNCELWKYIIWKDLCCSRHQSNIVYRIYIYFSKIVVQDKWLGIFYWIVNHFEYSWRRNWDYRLLLFDHQWQQFMYSYTLEKSYLDHHYFPRQAYTLLCYLLYCWFYKPAPRTTIKIPPARKLEKNYCSTIWAKLKPRQEQWIFPEKLALLQQIVLDMAWNYWDDEWH